MKGNEIIVSSNPKGVFLEGFVYGTPSPGTVMEIRGSVALIGGRFTWQVYTPGSDGNRRIIAVLLADQLHGKTATDAYVTGTRCYMYCPAMGEDMNMLIADVAGTGTSGTEAKAVGDLLMVEDGTGMLIDTSSPEAEPFILLEAQEEVIAANALLWCKFTGY